MCVCACSVGTVAAPVIREEADFSLPSRKDTLQAGLFRRVAHVLHHPLQQLQESHGRRKRKVKGYWGEISVFFSHHHFISPVCIHFNNGLSQMPTVGVLFFTLTNL